jgi:hypothetical protein
VAVAPPDTLLLYIHHVRGHSHNVSNDRRPNAQDSWPVRCVAQNNPKVTDVGNDHEVSLLDDGQRGVAALDRVQTAATSELVIHSGSCGHVGLLPEVELTIVKLLLVVDERRQHERLLLVVFVRGF